MAFEYEYARPALTVDCVVFGIDERGLEVLLIRRGLSPYKGRWALPGGYVREGESLDHAAARELEEEAGLQPRYLEQLYTFGEPKRDPRGHTVSVAYFALVNIRDHSVRAATDASDARFFVEDELPKLAFDHASIVARAKERLQGKLRYRPIGFELLPDAFPLSQLRHLYETVRGEEIDKRNFRKKILSLDLLVETDERTTGPGRPARLYRFDRGRYQELEERGFDFSL